MVYYCIIFLLLFISKVGYAVTTYTNDNKNAAAPSGECPPHQTSTPVIGFDMGGTSTDVSRFAGEYEHVFEATVAGVSIQAPQVNNPCSDIHLELGDIGY